MSVAINTGAPHSFVPPKKPRKTLIQAIKKMNGKAVMQPGDTPTGDDEHQVEVQPAVKGVGQVSERASKRSWSWYREHRVWTWTWR